MITLVDLVANTGFPIAISLWFLFKLEGVIKDNTRALARVEEVLDNILQYNRNKPN